MKAGSMTGQKERKKFLSRIGYVSQHRAILLFVALLPLTLLSGCIGKLNSSAPATQAAIQFTPANLNFGNVSVGKKVTQSVAIKNSGTTTLNITAANLTGRQFTLSGITFPFSLVAGSTANLSVSFNGSSTGTSRGNLTLETDSGSISTPVTLIANAVPAAPQLSPSPAAVGFGSVTTGTTDTSSVTLTNTGGSDLTISIITLNGAEFGVGGITTPKTISSGQSVTMSASFTPTSTGSASGSLQINSNDPQSPAVIALSGNGTANPVGKLALNPGTLAFGNVTVGSNNTLSSSITNSGQATVHISQVSSTGSGVTTSGLAAGSTIAAGQFASLQVRYAPTAAATLNGSVTIVSDASVSPTILSLTGAGVSSTPPTISITAPNSASTVSGTVNVTAAATASAGVANVQFQLDGANVGAAVTSSPYSYAWDTTKSSNGSHSLTAIVTDAANTKATSSSVTVTVKNTAPDTTPPTVAITSPASGSNVSGTITVSANASDNVAVASVQFTVDGQNVGSADTSAPYTLSLNTKTLTNGSHTLAAVATDTSNNKATSAGVSLTVNNSAADTTPPTVSITSPVSGSTVSGTVSLNANASDNVAVASVQFRVDGNNVGSAITSAPYSYSWNTATLANGGHTLTAVATDTSNNQATSAGVSITVNNAAANQPSVSITSPVAGTTVSGTVSLTATASDSSGIASVQFQVDGTNLGAADTTTPYSQSWNSATVADGPHTLTAVATSTSGSRQPASANAVVIVNNSGSGSALSSTPGWHKIPSTALCGGGSEHNAPFTDPDNFPNNLNPAYASYGFGFTSQCYNILEDSNSGAYDTLRHRLILYGGGHEHYWGNDVFSLELSLVNTSAPRAMFHLDHSANPVTCPSTGSAGSFSEGNGAICQFNGAGAVSTVLGLPGCTYTAGCTPTQTTTPSSVHTYNTTVYIPGYDEMTVFGGATSPNGNAGQNAWLLSMSSVLYTCAPNTTTNQQGCNPVWTPIGNPASNNAYVNIYGVGSTAAYDPNTNGVWTQNQSGLEWFNPATKTLTVENSSGIGYHSTAVLDPVDKFLILIGPQSTNPKEGILYVNVACTNPPACTGSNFTLNQPATIGCANLTGGNNANPQYMGAAWDPIKQSVAIYPNGGNSIWHLDPKTWTCTSETYGSTQGTDYPQITPVPSGDAGTFGHFAYDPVLDVFVLCNDPNNDCWYLRPNRSGSSGSSGSSSSGGDPTLANSITSPGSGANVSGTITVTANASGSLAIASVQFQVDGASLGAPDTTAPYAVSLNTTTLANGSHTLTAIATDASNNKVTSPAVSITVNNTVQTPVTVSITSPTSGSSVSGTVSVAANASAGAGIGSVQFFLDGANLGAASTSSPYSVSWNTATASSGAHVLAAKATDMSGNSATSGGVNVTIVSQTGPPPPPPAGDDVTISDATGSGQLNRAVSISRAFVQGEITGFAQASINGTALLTQCDVKNRWPDGSLKFAIVSFVIPTIPANGSVVVSFSDQGSGNNTGYLAQSDMLGAGYNFDGQIRLTGAASRNISARAILNAAGSCHDPGSDPDSGQFVCTYWLKGPIVTAVILEDRANRSFDVNTDGGTGNPLHPIFEAWFYPQGNLVQLGYTLENSWASSNPSNSARDQVYSVVLTGGNANPAAEFTNPSFTHITRSRWHRSFCVNGAGAGSAYMCGPTVHINQNWAYLAGTKFTPHWDPNLTIAASKISNEVSSFASTNHTLGGNANGVGFYPGPNQGGMNATGAAEYHGPLTTWDIITLMSQDPTMLPVTLGNADLGNALPYFYREADSNAGHGQTFDNSGVPGNVQTEGRIVSINARTQVSLLDATAQSCNNSYPADWINFGTGGQDAGVWGTGELDTSHWPNLAYASYLLTGQYAYYEEQLMQSAYALAASPGSRACAQPTGNSALRMGSAGYWYIDQERGTDWMARENFLGAFIAVDGSPEKAYLEDKLRTNIAVWEGAHQIVNDLGGSYFTAWMYGNTARIANLSAAGTVLGAWTHGPAVGPNGYAADFPLCLGNTSGSCPSSQLSTSPQDANSNFQNAYSAVIIGWINDLGYCPGNCAILGYVANHFINEALNPASNIYHLSDYVFPTLDANGGEITSWTEDQAFYVPGGQPTTWPKCGSQNPDEWYTGEDMAAMSYFYTMTSSQGGYSGATAYNTLRSAQHALGCVNNSPGADFPTASPKWDITPRATSPTPAP